MHVRQVVLKPQTTAALANTAVYNLPSKGLCLGFMIEVTVATITNSMLTLSKWRPCDYFEKIEVLANGDHDILSTTMSLMLAREFFNKGTPPRAWWRSYATGTTRALVFHSFGPQGFDLQYAYDLSKVDSSVLNITNDMTATHWGTPALNVRLFMLDDPIGAAGSKGYFRTQVYKKYTPAQDGTETTTLPETGKLRRVLMQAIPARGTAGLDDTTFTNILYDIVYTLKSGAKIIFSDRG